MVNSGTLARVLSFWTQVRRNAMETTLHFTQTKESQVTSTCWQSIIKFILWHQPTPVPGFQTMYLHSADHYCQTLPKLSTKIRKIYSTARLPTPRVAQSSGPTGAIWWELLKRAAYSLDTSPYDFYGFGPLKKALKNRTFTVAYNVQEAAAHQILSGWDMLLLHHCDSCIIFWYMQYLNPWASLTVLQLYMPHITISVTWHGNI
jgi:hypothetical protein